MKLHICLNGNVVFDSELLPSDELSISLSNEQIQPTVSKFTEEALNQFDTFRKSYPGKKRGNDTEFLNFRKRHKDYRDVLPLLLPAVLEQQKEKNRRKFMREFVAEWPNLQTWINQRRWEEECAVHVSTAPQIEKVIKFHSI